MTEGLVTNGDIDRQKWRRSFTKGEQASTTHMQWQGKRRRENLESYHLEEPYEKLMQNDTK